MQTLRLTLFVVGLALVGAHLAHAEPTDSSPPAPTSASSSSDWKLFEVGGYILGQTPSKFDPDFTDVNGYGLGLGYGLLAGIRPLPFVTFGLFVDGAWQSVDIPTTSNSEYATGGAVGVNTKIYPMGDSEFRFYATAGIGLATYWVHPQFRILAVEGEGASYRGYRMNFGVGYEYPFLPNLSLFGELNVIKTTLTKRVIADQPSIDLAQNMSRWTPSILLGVTAHF